MLIRPRLARLFFAKDFIADAIRAAGKGGLRRREQRFFAKKRAKNSC
jgi:hypothetical protein